MFTVLPLKEFFKDLESNHKSKQLEEMALYRFVKTFSSYIYENNT